MCVFYTSIVSNNDINNYSKVITIITIIITQGGIKAVVWTDALQAVVLFGSFLGIIIYGYSDTGHFHNVFDLNYQTDRVELVE